MDKEEKRKYNKLYAEKNKEKIRIRKNEYKKSHKIEISEYNKKYSQENREKIIERKRITYLKNIEYNKDYANKYNKTHHEENKKYRNEHKVEIALRGKKWREKNPNYYKKYYKNHPEKDRLRGMKSNLKRKNWGCNPINKYCNGFEFHHLHINGDHSIGIYMPSILHRSIKHKNYDKESMNKINKITVEWYYEETIMINKINIKMEEI